MPTNWTTWKTLDKLLETYSMPRLIQEETENLNRPITAKQVESVIEERQTNQSSRPDGFTGEFHQTFQGELLPPLRKPVPPKNGRGGNASTLILRSQPCSDTKTRQRHYKKPENYRPVSLRSIEAKMLNKILANWIQQYIKKIIHHDQVGFIPGVQGGFKICKPLNVIHHINKMKDKNNAIVSTDAEKAFD